MRHTADIKPGDGQHREDNGQVVPRAALAVACQPNAAAAQATRVAVERLAATLSDQVFGLTQRLRLGLAERGLQGLETAKELNATLKQAREERPPEIPHNTLDPQGLRFRESRDSAEHPASTAIFISLDVTGSMGAVVRGIHADLPRLHELLLGHNYVTDPQILFAAVGDATCDRVPLQVGQFESDNRMDQNLENLILEGGGGGQKTESYELMLYVAARHTAMDCIEKHGRKGYLFVIGDEMAYPYVYRKLVKQLTGNDPERDIPLAEIVEEVKKKFHTYFIIPGGASYGADTQVLAFWNNLLGENRVLHLESPEDTSECIAQTIGVTEGTIPQPSKGIWQRLMGG